MSSAGLGFSLLTALCWGSAAIFDKLALRSLSPKAAFIARCYLACVLLLAPLVLGWEETRWAVFRAERRAVAYLAGSVLLTVSGLLLYYYALSASDASRIVSLCAAYPLVSFLLAVLILREPMTAARLAGTFLVVGGAFLLARD